jgi:hypothetical protein
MQQAKRVMIFYFFLVCSNLAIFFYEIHLIGISLDQSLAIRGMTLITDLVESILFINSKLFDDIAIFILKVLHIKTWNWIEGGFKMAIIAPTMYAAKLVVFNCFLYLIDFGITPIDSEKIWLAYGLSFILSFSWGAGYVLFLEDTANFFLRQFQNLFRKKLVLDQK